MRGYAELADELALEQAAEAEGNLDQDTTPERRSEAVRLADVAQLPVPAVEENLDQVRQEFDGSYAKIADDLKEAEVTQTLAQDPDLGPAAADSLEQLGIFEKLLIHQGRRVFKGVRTHQLGMLGLEGVKNNGLTPEQTEELKYLEETTPQDLGLFENENGFVSTAAFITGAMAEQVPIWGLMLFESADEILKGASMGAVVGAAAASVPTAGVGAPVGAAGGAAIGATAAGKIGFIEQSFALEGGHAWLEYSRMRDQDGNLMDPDVARGAAVFAGIGAAALETVGFERVLRAGGPQVDRVLRLMTRGGAKKLMKNPAARQAFKEFGKRIAGATVMEGITEGGQELVVSLMGVVAGEFAEGEFDTDSFTEQLWRAWEGSKQGMAGGGGIATVIGTPQYAIERRAETQAIRAAEQLAEIADTAKNTPLAERLPQVFKAQMQAIREQYGENTETLVDRGKLEQFFQEAGLSEAEIAERLPLTAESMEEAGVAGTEVVVPYEELVSELARMDGFENLVPDIRIDADGFTARQAEEVAAERETVLAEWQELVGREEAAEQASDTPAGRVYEDVYRQTLAAGRSVQEAEGIAELHQRLAVSTAARLKVDAWDWYRASNLRIGQDLAGEPRGETYDRFDAVLDNLRAGDYPTQYGMFGQSLVEFLRAEGGLMDEGGELAARDLGGPGGLMSKGKRAMSFETAHQKAIEAGFMPEESWQDSSSGDLLALIDEDLAGNRIHQAGAGDLAQQQLMDEMVRTEELLNALGVDLETMSNQDVRALVEESSYYQREKPKDYEKLDKKTKAIVDEALADMVDGDEVRQRLIDLAGTPWASQAIDGAKARVAMKRIMAGKEPEFESSMDAPMAQQMRAALKKGPEGIATYMQAKSILGHPGKPVNAVNSSFLNCLPSANCAKYCYATKGNYLYDVNVNKGELVSFFVENFPKEAAQLSAAQYKAMPEYAAGKALRLFDKGDGSAAWLPYIKEMNRRGVRLHIFSKRPEFLRQVPDGNVKLLSIDESNLELADQNPDLPIAMVYQHEREVAWLVEHEDQLQLILPIMGSKGAAARARKAEIVAAIPKKMRKKLCPIDAERKVITSGKVKWDCTRCDAGGGIGCYNEQTTKMVGNSITVPFPTMVEKNATKQTLNELEVVANALPGQEREVLLEELAQLISQARAGIDVEAESDGEGLANRTTTQAESGARAVGPLGTREVKKLYQIEGFHGTGMGSLQEFLDEHIGSANGLAYGYGHYIATTEEVAAAFMGLAESGGDLVDRIVATATPQMERDLDYLFGENKGFTIIDWLGEALGETRGDVAATIAYAEQKREQWLDMDEPVSAGIWNDIASLLERYPDNEDVVRMLEASAQQLDPGLIRARIDRLPGEFLDWNKPLPAEKLELARAHAERNGSTELEAELRKIGEQEWTGEVFYEWLAGYFDDSPQAASEFLGAAGIPGNTYLGYEGVEMGAPSQRTYVVFSGRDITVEDRLYQDTMKRPRGYITFDETRAWFKITLTERANLSTLLHESGHFFLESLRRMAASPNAPAEVIRDLDLVYKWLGAEPGTPLTREHHEKWARGFEQYLMNGEAPSSALRETFQKFKTWLVSIYRRLSALDVEMSPEVRGVMDRLLATEEEITAAQQATGYTEPVFETAEEAGMSELDFAAYHRLHAKGLAAAKEELDLKQIQELARTHQAEYKQRRREVQAEVEAQIAQDPVQVAKHFLRTGKLLDGAEVPDHLKGMKLNSSHLQDMYPNVKILRRLAGMYRKDGMNPDLVASYFEFDSGDAFIQAMLAAPKRADLVKQRTDARMLELYPDSAIDGTLPAKALAAMHNNDVSRFLLAELKVLAKQAGGGAATPLDIIKQAARERVEAMRLQNLQPGRYRAAEQREANRAIKEAANQNFVAAVDAKRKQLMNHWMYRYVLEAREKGTKQREYLRKFDDGKLRQRWAQGGSITYLDAIDTYLEGIDLRQVSLKRQAALQDLAAWLKRREEADEAVQIPEKLRHQANLKNWKQMTTAEMDELVNAVKNIEHLAKLKNKLVAGKKARDFNEAKDALIAQIYTTQTVTEKAKTQNPRMVARMLDPVLQFQAELTKPEFIARWIDGETAGTAHELFFQPFVDAQIEKLDMEIELGRKLEAIFGGMSKAQKAKMHRKYDVFGVETTGQEVIALALNLGNEGNTRKLLEGERRGWTEETLRARLEEIMTLEDWRTVQAVWDTVETLWPAIKALHEEMTGVAPPKVESREFTVQGETFRGGYYPVIYDPDKTPRHFKQAEQKAAEGLFQNNFMRPNVSKGFTEARKANYARPLLLSLDVLPAHLSEVIHYITHYKPVTEVHKLMENAEVKEALIATFGTHIQRQFLPWIQAIAQAAKVPPATSKIDSFVRYSRHATSVIAMGFKFSTAMMQAFGLFTSVDQIGVKYTMLGLVEAAKQLGAGTRTFADINEKSGEVRHTMRTFDRDARQIIDQTFGKRGIGREWSKVQGFTFVFMGTMQKMVNMATWYGSYRKSIDEGKTARRATNIADASVRQSQSGGGMKDLAAIQRGGEATQLMTLFYTYFSVLHNRLSETGRQAMGKQRVKDSPVVAARLAWLIFLPVIFEAVMRGSEPEDPDKRAAWWLKQFALYGVVTIPVVRDIASGVMGEYGYTFTPVAGTIDKIVRGLGGIGDAIDPNEEMTEGEVKGLLNAAGFAAKLPAGQLWVLYKWFEGFKEGTLEEPVRELIYQKRREQ